MPTLDELSSEQPHETAEADEFDAPVVQSGLQFGLERHAILAKWLAFNDEGLDAGCSGSGEARRVGLIGNDDRDLSRKVRGFRSFHQRYHVRSASGNQDGDTAFHALIPCGGVLHREIEMAVVNDTSFIAGDDHVTEQRNALTGLRQHVRDLLNRITAHDRDHSDTAIEGSKHFAFGYAALMRQPFEHRKYRQPGEIDPHTEILRAVREECCR